MRPLDMHIKSGRKLKNLRTHRTDLYSMFFLFLNVNQTQFGWHMKADYDAAFLEQALENGCKNNDPFIKGY